MRIHKLIAPMLFLLLSPQLRAANEKETTEQVTSTISLTTDVDYVVTSDTPFGDEGVVNIENAEHAVLILKSVKPSKARRLLANHVLIDGQKAVDGTNCQLKLYNRGSIIMPYAKDLKPLTVYSEPNFSGEATDDFGLGHTGGFMNTLSDKQLNNRIRSFRLKRGYMVTFALKAGGKGYSRCFIAADSDLEMASLPAIMDQSISSYRIFKWYDTGKPQLAATDAASCSALNVTSTYTWGTTSDMAPDLENVPHHIYENYPAPSALGACTTSPHMKTNNEPMNTADDPKGQTESVDDVLANWEDLMRTGMRLCTPSSWDGSDYTNGTGYLKRFLDSIDARGWRCDIIDLHCYWPESNFSTIKNWTNNCHRPVWISEWCWGASWNHNGAFADGVTQNQVRDALKRICNNLNSYDFVERYYYWNHEADISKLYKNGQLTPAGEMYAELDGGLGYNGKYDYIPRAPKQQDPADLTVDFDKQTLKANLSWKEYNGEMNEYILVECRKGSGHPWETVREVKGGETAGLCTVSEVDARLGWEFRIREKDANGKERTTKATTVATSELEAGDAIDIDGETWYLGGNLLLNGDFETNFYGWLDGEKKEVAGQPWFQIVPVGGSDGGCFLQCYGSGSWKSEEALRANLKLEKDSYYYFSADVANNPNITSRLALSADGEALDSTVARLTNNGNNWQTVFVVFNSSRFEQAILTLGNLACKAQFDNIKLCPLYKIWNMSVIDGMQQERVRTQTVIQQLDQQLALALQQHLDSSDDVELFPPGSQRSIINYLRKHTAEALHSQRLRPELERLILRATSALDYHFPGREQLATLIGSINTMLASNGALPATDAITTAYEALKDALDNYMPMTAIDDKVQSPTFASTTGWHTKSGSYQGGKQLAVDGSYWQALWNIEKEGNEDQTMAISQTITGLDHGLYSVECLATTDHFCLSDQHVFASNADDTVSSPTLTADYMDLPSLADSLRWQTLTTHPLYIGDGDTLTIGFQGSKEGATDLAWHEVGNTASRGDHREGSWMATAFRLRFHPLYRPAGNNEWGVVCLPYAVAPTPGVSYYQIAALTSDYKQLCLEAIAQPEAGVPFIYRSAGGTVSLPEHGEAVDRASDGPGNLRGFFKTAARVPVGYYVLTDGKWTKLTDSNNRPRINSYSAIIRPLNDKQSEPIAVVDSWAGPTMPIEGISEEEIADAIATPTANSGETYTQLFDLQGRSISSPTSAKGIYIIVKNGKTTKTIVK